MQRHAVQVPNQLDEQEPMSRILRSKGLEVFEV